jgi:hypothetical protein
MSERRAVGRERSSCRRRRQLTRDGAALVCARADPVPALAGAQPTAEDEEAHAALATAFLNEPEAGAAGGSAVDPAVLHARTPLHLAAHHGDAAELAAALAAAGAEDAGASGSGGGGSGAAGVLAALAARTRGAKHAGRTPLHLAAMRARADAATALLTAARDAGGHAAVAAALRAADDDGKKALMHAASARGAAACETLLRFASDAGMLQAVLDASETHGRTAYAPGRCLAIALA